MALYPSLFALYLGKFSPALTEGSRAYAWKLAIVVLCCAWNLLGAPRIGHDSVWMSALLLAPFAIFAIIGLSSGIIFHPAAALHNLTIGPASSAGFSTALLVAMWNYMGWDNASTVARDVENPQHNYPRAMIASVLVVASTYVLPLAAMALAGLSPASFSTGDWTTSARTIGGPLLALAVAAGGCITGIGMFNALTMSYARLPIAIAAEGMLPAALLRRNSRGVPWVSLVLCGLTWAMALNLPFERLISIDLVLYGASLTLEFVALIVLRLREPNLPRPFRVGNLATACLLAVCPVALIGYALYASRDEKVLGGISALVFAAAVAFLGLPLYGLTVAIRKRMPAEIIPVTD
jgi:amino acid transporter